MYRTVLFVLIVLVAGGQSKQPKPAKPVTNKPPVISKFETSASILFTCGEKMFCEKRTRRTVSLSVAASDPEGDELKYEYSVNGGEILGEGASVSWKLGDQPPKEYAVTVTVSDSKGSTASSVLRVMVSHCLSCWFPDPPCPVVSIQTQNRLIPDEETYRGEILSFHANVLTDALLQSRPDYLWTVTNGKITKGQHTP